MCFGPVASFTAAGILTAIGSAVLKNVRARKEIFLALFPLLFAVQQFTEGWLWLLLRSGKSGVLQQGLTFTFLIFAYVIWPVLCPVSVYAIEYNHRRRRLLLLLIFMGICTSSYLLFFIFKNSIQAVALTCQIRYETHLSRAYLFTGVYMVATILPYFLSSHRAILIFGIPNLIFCIIAYFFYNFAFTSVWCFFAAIISVSFYFFLRRLHHQPLLPIRLIQENKWRPFIAFRTKGSASKVSFFR